MITKKSEKVWKLSQDVFPGGVNSPVRSFNSVKPKPISLKSGLGCYVWDEDKNQYLDFVNSWGPLILGHSPKPVCKAIQKAIKKGTSFGTITLKELELGQMILKHIPHVDKIRFVNSGTEAVMTGIRLARAFTDRNKIVKFSGCYHGHVDSLLVEAGSGLLTNSNKITEASSLGIPASFTSETLVLPLDDEVALESLFNSWGDEIAAIIIEPLPANSGLLKQELNFLQKVREIANHYGSLVIFDEVISGFRLGISGFSGKYHLHPDLITYGKIIGGGLPVGAIAGRQEIMDYLAPIGKVYQAGTLSGNPLAMSAGLATLQTILNLDTYSHLNKLAQYMEEIFNEIVLPETKYTPFQLKLIQEESIFWLSFSDKEDISHIRKVDQIHPNSKKWYASIHSKLLKLGIHMPPSAYEVAFLSQPMTHREIDNWAISIQKAIKEINQKNEW